MEATKILTAVNDVLELDYPEGFNGAVGIQYGAGGLGTVILEGMVGSGQGIWNVIGLKSYSDPSAAAAANIAAAGMLWAECPGLAKIRARKTVAGGGDVLVSLNYQQG